MIKNALLFELIEVSDFLPSHTPPNALPSQPPSQSCFHIRRDRTSCRKSGPTPRAEGGAPFSRKFLHRFHTDSVAPALDDCAAAACASATWPRA